MANVTLQGVVKSFPGHVAVDGLHLDVKDQEFLVLVGPSGCGKSTTLRLIAGLESPSAGEIQIGERVVNNVQPKNRNVAMVFQNYALYPHMTVYQNMAFGLRLRYGGWLQRLWLRLTNADLAATNTEFRKQIPEKVRQTAAKLGIESLLNRLPRQLSGGERQRVALGRAMVRQPDAFLFDEPLSNLDAKLRVEMRRELKRLHRELRATVIYVTHDQVEALTLGDRIVIMNKGRIQQIGKPMEVYETPANLFVAGFIGSPPMNLIPGRMTVKDGQQRFEGGGLSVSAIDVSNSPLSDDLQVVLGVRPEAVELLIDEGVEKGNFPWRVVLIESLGDASFVHVERVDSSGKVDSSEHTTIIAKLEQRHQCNEGDLVGIKLNPHRCHLFDAKSGERFAVISAD